MYSAIFAFAIMLTALLSALQSESIATNNTFPSVSISESSLGIKVSLEQAKQMTTFKLKIPKTLPEKTEILQIYVSKDGRQATVLYSNPYMKTISESLHDDVPQAQIKLFMERRHDNPIDSLEKGLPPLKIEIIDQGKAEQPTYVGQPLQFSKVTVNNAKGAMFEPDESKRTYAPVLWWWENSTLYSLTADLSETELIRIAESME
jgi:hypothetical protein